MTYTAFEVGTAEFRQSVSAPKLHRLLAVHPVVEVGRYKDEPAAVVLSPTVFAAMRSDHEQLARLQALLPLLVAALSAGVAVPSDTLGRLGVALPDDTWQTLNDLQARLPVRFALGEQGEPITHGRLHASRSADELDEKLVHLEE